MHAGPLIGVAMSNCRHRNRGHIPKTEKLATDGIAVAPHKRCLFGFVSSRGRNATRPTANRARLLARIVSSFVLN